MRKLCGQARRSAASAAGYGAVLAGVMLWGVPGCSLLPQEAAAEAAPDSAGQRPVPQAAALEAGGADLSATARDGVTVSATGLLDLHVREEEIATVLEMLSYEARANIVTSNQVSGKVSANLYGVTLEDALAAVLSPSQYAFRITGGTVFVGTAEEIAALRPPPITKVLRLRYLAPGEAATAVRAVLGPQGQVVESLWSSTGDAKKGELGSTGGDYLIITDYPDRIEAARALLEEIDVRPRQVLIEATLLRATLTETNQFGIDFTMLGGVDFQNVGSTSNASADLTTGPLPPDRLQNTTFNLNTDFAGAVNDGGFSFGLIKDNIALFIRALEEITDVVVVANPKVTALNKQEAEVIVGRRDGYLTTTVTETAAVQTVEFLETGTQIRFRPVINPDGTVRMSVHPKDSNGGLSAANLPFEETTEAHADILVNDGDTVLIGGLFRERTVNSKAQIPVLGNVPVAGLLFGSRNDQTVREEVIILLTVHVLKETPAERAEFEGLREDIERMRVGSRLGLVGTGRERLAQAFFHEALRQLEQGDLDKALLNVRCTLNNQPKHLGALRLQEQLVGKRLWDDEGSRMRTFAWELIQRESTPRPPPPFGRPDPERLLEAVPLPPESPQDGESSRSAEADAPSAAGQESRDAP